MHTFLQPAEAGKFIADNSKHVTINKASVQTLGTQIAETFLEKKYSFSTWKEHVLHPQIPDETAIDFIFAMDTLNFSFWPDDPESKFTVVYNGTAYTGFWSIVAALRRANDEGKPVSSAKYMSSVSREEFAYMCRSDSKAAIPMLAERYKVYTEAGRVLLEKFDGSFVNCIRACNKDAVKLVQMIASNFSSYQDVAEYEGRKVAFFKRAQIVVANIWCCFEGKGMGEFNNIDQLTMFADYRVPQALEYFGILEYSAELKEVLESQTVLTSGSRYELEIRGCSIEAVERLKLVAHSFVRQQSGSEGTNHANVIGILNSIMIDYFLWDYAKAHRAELAKLPIHKVRSVYY